MGLVSGKGSGYYGCLRATKSGCANKLLVSRRIAERRVLSVLHEHVADMQAVRYVLERVEVEVKRLHADLPSELKLKRAALAAEERRIENFIGFIGDGKGTRALGAALELAETKASALREELQILEATADAVFEAPPVEWIAERLSHARELLERHTAPPCSCGGSSARSGYVP